MTSPTPPSIILVYSWRREAVVLVSVREGLRSSAWIIQKNLWARRNREVGFGLNEAAQLLTFIRAHGLPASSHAVWGEGTEHITALDHFSNPVRLP